MHPESIMRHLTVFLAVATLGTASCGYFKPRSYPLNTCVVCDQTLHRYGDPVIFVRDRQEVFVCSEEHRKEFVENPNRFMKKILQVKFL